MSTSGSDNPVPPSESSDLASVSQALETASGQIRSSYRGVTWDRRDRKWRVRISCLGAQHHVGRYFDEAEAAKVYDKVSYMLYGDAAVTNFGLDAAPHHTVAIPPSMIRLKARHTLWKQQQLALMQAGAAEVAAAGANAMGMGHCNNLMLPQPISSASTMTTACGQVLTLVHPNGSSMVPLAGTGAPTPLDLRRSGSSDSSTSSWVSPPGLMVVNNNGLMTPGSAAGGALYAVPTQSNLMQPGGSMAHGTGGYWVPAGGPASPGFMPTGVAAASALMAGPGNRGPDSWPVHSTGLLVLPGAGGGTKPSAASHPAAQAVLGMAPQSPVSEGELLMVSHLLPPQQQQQHQQLGDVYVDITGATVGMTPDQGLQQMGCIALGPQQGGAGAQMMVQVPAGSWVPAGTQVMPPVAPPLGSMAGPAAPPMMQLLAH